MIKKNRQNTNWVASDHDDSNSSDKYNIKNSITEYNAKVEEIGELFDGENESFKTLFQPAERGKDEDEDDDDDDDDEDEDESEDESEDEDEVEVEVEVEVEFDCNIKKLENFVYDAKKYFHVDNDIDRYKHEHAYKCLNNKLDLVNKDFAIKLKECENLIKNLWERWEAYRNDEYQKYLNEQKEKFEETVKTHFKENFVKIIEYTDFTHFYKFDKKNTDIQNFIKTDCKPTDDIITIIENLAGAIEKEEEDNAPEFQESTSK